VIVPSATTLAKVPASVERRPPLYVPRERRDDITLDRRERFTPKIINKMQDLIPGEMHYRKDFPKYFGNMCFEFLLPLTILIDGVRTTILVHFLN
jgi:hypothetical protein